MKRNLILILILLFASCSTLNRLKTADYMHIMVYDYDNNMVQGMQFYIDDELKGISDIYGRFILEIPLEVDSSKVHTLRGVKAGYMDITDEINFVSSGVFYYKTGTAEQYLAESEKAIEDGNLKEALIQIERAENLEKADDILALKVIILKKLNRVDEALKTADEITEANREKIRSILL